MADEKPWDRWARETKGRVQTPTGWNGVSGLADVPFEKKKLNRWAWDDNIVNTLCLATGENWRTVFGDICTIGYRLEAMPFNQPALLAYMEEHHFPQVERVYHMGVREFTLLHGKGRYVILLDGDCNTGTNIEDLTCAVVHGHVTGNFDARDCLVKKAFEIPEDYTARGPAPALVLPEDHGTSGIHLRHDLLPGSAILTRTGPVTSAVDDCVIQSLAVVTDRSWLSIYAEACELGYNYRCMPHSYRMVREFMKKHGGRQLTLEKGAANKVGTFARTHPKGRYILPCKGHCTAAIDGVVYDSCSSEVVYLSPMMAFQVGE